MTQEVWKAKGDELNRYLRIDTFPLGVNFLKKGNAFPEKTMTPSSMGIKIAVCQATNIARRWGWSIGVTRDDINCIPALIGFGWREPESPDAIVDYLMSMAYFETKDAAIKTLQKMTIMEPKRFEKLYISPLAKTKLDPDAVVIYGNPAQMMRIAQGYIYKKGGVVSSETNLGFTCANEMIWPLKEGKACFIHPGRGERTLGLTQDHEMAFSLPASQVDDLITGLEATHKGGSRYPVQSYLLFEAMQIPQFEELEKRLKP
jgi:uncharacterized protein (DUF169 family)